MIELIFNTENGVTAIREGDNKMYLVEKYIPINNIEISSSRKLKIIPAKWNTINILKALCDVMELKRGIKYAIRVLENDEDEDKIGDRNARRILKAVRAVIDHDFDGEHLIKLADTVRDINNKIRKKIRFSRSTK